MTNLWFSVEIFTDTMTNERFHYIQIICVCEVLNNGTDLLEWHTWSTHANTMMQSLFGFFDQVSADFVHIADEKRSRAITMEAIQEYGDVNVYDVAINQWPIVGNTMANDIVHRRANGLRETGIEQWRRVCICGSCFLVNESIDVVGCNSWLTKVMASLQHTIANTLQPWRWHWQPSHLYNFGAFLQNVSSEPTTIPHS